MEKWYVNYTVNMPDGPILFQTGPFLFEHIAQDNQDDIRGYSGISDCYITTVPAPERRQIVNVE